MYAIKIEGLGKKYLIRHQINRRLYDALGEWFSRIGRRIRHPFIERSKPRNIEEFWALKNLSFGVQEGERVAIVGHNGAGKSTLLKILSRITYPTEGRISLKGRIASLLEVGTGFHPELTGRENIYLNAAILGMRSWEIKKNFDDIVEFSGVEKFIDMPIKRYSSGMSVRLAFAIAAHLTSEILIVDEVLAVGDLEFQKKCMGKMDEISHKEGRTILFVSHNMGAVLQLCNRVICLEHGQMVFDTDDVVDGANRYMSLAKPEEYVSEWLNPGDKYESEYFKPLRFGIYTHDGKKNSGERRRHDELFVEIEGIVKKPHKALCVGYCMKDQAGSVIYWTYHSDQAKSPDEIPTLDGHVCLRSRVPLEILNLGKKNLELAIRIYNGDWIAAPGGTNPAALTFMLEGPMNDSPYCVIQRTGPTAIDGTWQLA